MSLVLVFFSAWIEWKHGILKLLHFVIGTNTLHSEGLLHREFKFEEIVKPF